MMILAILQARVSSRRLPGKVLKEILGKPVLQWMTDRIAPARRIDRVVVATSAGVEDAPLADFCRARGIDCFRGSLEDVLDRFYQCAQAYKPDHIVRLTADCPLLSHDLIDELVEFHLREGNDYSTNSPEPPSLPDGLDAEMMTFSALEKSWRSAKLPSEREHVTSYIYNHPELFKIGSLAYSPDLSKLRWTIDEPEDLALVTRIIEGVYPQKNDFDRHDVLKYLDAHPDLKTANVMHERNEGYAHSLEQDKRTTHG